MGTLFMGKKNSIQIRHAQLKYLSVGLKLKLRSILSYPSNIPNLMESLDSGHATVKTENSQPGLSQGQDPSSRVLLRSTRVATHPLLFKYEAHSSGQQLIPELCVLDSLLHLVVESNLEW